MKRISFLSILIAVPIIVAIFTPTTLAQLGEI